MRILPFAVAFFLSVTILSAQSIETAWFGGVGVGIGAHDNEAFSDRLQSWSPRGSDGLEIVYRSDRFPFTGYTLNAGGAGLFGGGYVVGANGERLMFPSVSAVTSTDEQSEYVLTGGGGGLDLGYAVVNTSGTLLYPFAHIGYYGYSLEFTNNQSDSIPFFEGFPVAPGQKGTYSGAAPRFGLGVGLTRFIGGLSGGSSTSGPVLQVRLGWGMFAGHPEWEQNGLTVTNGGHTPCYSAVALSVSIGGGGASY